MLYANFYDFSLFYTAPFIGYLTNLGSKEWKLTVTIRYLFGNLLNSHIILTELVRLFRLNNKVLMAANSGRDIMAVYSKPDIQSRNYSTDIF